MKIKENLLIGLEIHITINSKKKIFSKVDTFLDKGEKVNTLVSPWELGYLGVLPVLNPEVIKKAIILAKSLDMKIENKIEFDRKIYQYFDLPKGYQITQYKKPLGVNGKIKIINDNDETKEIAIKSIHLEEDTAKSLYLDKKKVLLDFNRAGNPLIELVTNPIFNKIEEIEEFINNLCFYLRYLDVSDAKMEKGRMRVDANFSVKFSDLEDENKIREWNSPRYELKNFNSVKKIERGIRKEINRLREVFVKKNEKDENNEDLTLSYDERKDEIKLNRKKEKYLYLPEINIPILKISDKEIELISRTNNELSPWFIWEKMKKNGEIKGIDYKFFLKDENLIKFFDIIEKNDKEIKKNVFFKFYLDHLFIYSKEDKYKIEFEKIKKNWSSIKELFNNWKEKKINKEEIKEKIYKMLIKNEELNNEKDENELKIIEEEKKMIKKLWISLKEEIMIQKKEGKRIKNFFLGEIRKKVKKISKNIVEEVDKIIEENE